MKFILFVCTGNICRSPMAEALLRHMLDKAGIHGIEVFSRGVAAEVGEPMTDEAQDALRAAGIDGRAHRAAQLTAEDIQRADLVLVMEDHHAHYIQTRFPAADLDKVHLLKEYGGGPADDREVADPYGGSPEDYEKCKTEIQDSLLGLFQKLKE